MNKERFIAQLTNPKIIGVKEISDWEDITKKHPYFQAAKSIYLKSLKQNNNFKYNKVLKETAAMTTDRTVLFEYITDIRPIQKRAVSEKSSKSSTFTPKTEPCLA